mgnify:FL=1
MKKFTFGRVVEKKHPAIEFDLREMHEALGIVDTKHWVIPGSIINVEIEGTGETLHLSMRWNNEAESSAPISFKVYRNAEKTPIFSLSCVKSYGGWIRPEYFMIGEALKTTDTLHKIHFRELLEPFRSLYAAAIQNTPAPSSQSIIGNLSRLLDNASKAPRVDHTTPP